MSVKEIKNEFLVTMTDGDTFPVIAGAAEPDKTGSLVFYKVYSSVLTSVHSPFKWLAPGTWKEVTRVERE